MTYRRMDKQTRRRIERRLETLFKKYGADAEIVCNTMINRRRTERRNKKTIAKLQREIEELR